MKIILRKSNYKMIIIGMIELNLKKDYLLINETYEKLLKNSKKT